MTFSLAHLSDPHLPLTDNMSFRQLRGKQILARLSWHRKRRWLHTGQPLRALLQDIVTYAPDHVAVTGDLINLAGRDEFLPARDFLAGLGDSEHVTLVPGNHDATVLQPWAQGFGHWAPWMESDSAGGGAFPLLRRRGEVAIIGLSSAIATPVFSAAGALGAAQLAALEQILARTGAEKLFRIIMIHHPPVMGRGGARKALRDRAGFCDVLQRQGAELVLHGHHHVTSLSSIAGQAGRRIPVFGVPAALAAGASRETAGWHLHRIARRAEGWRLETILRGYDQAQDRFRQAGAWTINLF
jgi:3',5'-cyclic AMP phosphodiesterase CpdA